MAYQEEKQVRIRRQIAKQAIATAMQSNWQESIALNKQIIGNFPNDVEAYNRLGKAYLELGQFKESKEAYTHALQLDQYNLIARKNLQRLARLGKGTIDLKGTAHKAEPHLFIEETGKAAVVNLYQLAPPTTLVKMVAGDKVFLKIKNSSLAVENAQEEELGLVPAKYAQRLVKLMKGGNRYTAAVVSAADNSLPVIIREIFKDPKQVGKVSFPSRRLDELPAYVGEQILRRELEEEEELVEAEGFVEEEVEPVIPEEAEEKDKSWEQEA